MFDTARQLHFTRSLEHFSTKLEELLEHARLQQSSLPPELADEIAFTTGELMIVLTNHTPHEEKSVREALAHAKNLREHLRIDRPQSDQLAEDCDNFRREIARLVVESKKAA